MIKINLEKSASFPHQTYLCGLKENQNCPEILGQFSFYRTHLLTIVNHFTNAHH